MELSEGAIRQLLSIKATGQCPSGNRGSDCMGCVLMLDELNEFVGDRCKTHAKNVLRALLKGEIERECE